MILSTFDSRTGYNGNAKDDLNFEALSNPRNGADSLTCSGCKIKALRAKTNTYIKTPARGEEPVFVVTGTKEEVAAAKKEILSAAEHFTTIRSF